MTRRGPVALLAVALGALALGTVALGTVAHGTVAADRMALALRLPRSRPSTASEGRAGGSALCAAAKRRGYVPDGDSCFSALRAQIDGDGRTDLVLLYGRPPRGAGASLKAWPETLAVVPGHGDVLQSRLAATTPPPGIVAVGNVNATPGAELFVYTSWFSSGPEVAVYTVDAGRLIREPVTLNFGGDSASRFGFDCLRTPTPEIVQRRYELIGPTIYGRWRVATDTFAWDGAMLRRVNHTSTIHRGLPSGSEIRIGTGCDPLPGFR